MARVDRSLLHTLNAFFVHHDGVEDPVKAYVGASQLLFAGLLAGLVLLGRAGRRAALGAGTATALALLAGQVISRLVDRPRPFVTDPHGVHLFLRHAADPGFPSDHATAAFAIAVAVCLRWRRSGLPLLALAALVAVGRVALGVHWPTDVVAGAAIGTLAALLVWLPPVRRRLDAVADRFSDACGAVAQRAGLVRPG